MRNPFQKLSLALVFLLPCSMALGQGPCLDPELRTSAVRLVPQGTNSFPLEATALLDLTHAVIDLKTGWRHRDSLAMGAEVPVVCFFRVELPRHTLEGNKVVGESAELDGKSEWIVAFYGERSFLFSQYWTGTVGKFNELARALNLRIGDPDDALDILDFFLQVAGAGQLWPHLAPDEMQLESLALKDFHWRFPAAKRRKAFARWWRSVSPTAKKAITPPKAVREGDGFRVQYVFYDNGSIWSSNLLVSSDGTVTEGQREAIGPAGGPQTLK